MKPSELPTTTVEEKCSSFVMGVIRSTRRRKVVDYRSLHTGRQLLAPDDTCTQAQSTTQHEEAGILVDLPVDAAPAPDDTCTQAQSTTQHEEAGILVDLPVDAAPAPDDTCTQAQSTTQHATIYKQEDGSFVIPAELLTAVEPGGMLELDLSHECGTFMHFVNDTAAGDRESVANEPQLEMDTEESEASEFSYGSAVLEEVSETENNSEVEADTDVSHGSKKRKRNPEKWAKNIRKYKAQHGEAYTSVYGHEVAAKSPKPRPCFCQPDKGYKCSEFSEDERLHLCELYWQLSDYSRKKDWLIKHVIEVPVRRRRADAMNTTRKGRSLQWYFPKGDEGRRRVCKKFFCSTLDIGKCAAPVTIALKNKNPIGTFAGGDNRGKRTPWNKTPESKVALVHEHLNIIPKMESHYCRKDSRKQYIDPQLSVPRLYELYLTWLKDKSSAAPADELLKNPVGERRYRDIFVNDFNISPFHPKKDQCVLCETWNSLSAVEKENRAQQKMEHDRNKEDAQNFKATVKAECVQDPSRCMATFDLEAILQLPCGQVSQLYYKRKLVVYNFTVYESPSGQGSCYLWTELDGCKGSDEIGTCLLKYFRSLPTSISKVDMFSDNCGGQNKNIQIVAVCLYAVNSIDHLNEIQHTFLETGHTHLECDSMHSAIEHAKKHVKVHSIDQWEGILTMARRKKPYKVTRLQYSDFYNLKALVTATVSNKSTDTDGQSVSWQKVRSLCFKSSSDGSLSRSVAYRYNLQDEYHHIQLSSAAPERVIRKSTRQCKSRSVASAAADNSASPVRSKSESVIALLPKYRSQIPISKAKKKDLMDLCRNKVIDEVYHSWYEALPVASGVVDKLPLPDVDEESCGE